MAKSRGPRNRDGQGSRGGDSMRPPSSRGPGGSGASTAPPPANKPVGKSTPAPAPASSLGPEQPPRPAEKLVERTRSATSRAPVAPPPDTGDSDPPPRNAPSTARSTAPSNAPPGPLDAMDASANTRAYDDLWDPLADWKARRRIQRIVTGVLLGGAALGAVVWFAVGRTPATVVQPEPAHTATVAAPARDASPDVRVAVAVVPVPVATDAASVTDAAVVAMSADAASADADNDNGAAARAALAADPVPAQPTDRLRELLTAAVAARSHSSTEAVGAMQAWIDAGGSDPRATAQFAYWLGRRDSLHPAEAWAERATVMDPQSQMAWYVLGATRLEDHGPTRRLAYDALRRCAALPGPFTRECLGPIQRPAR